MTRKELGMRKIVMWVVALGVGTLALAVQSSGTVGDAKVIEKAVLEANARMIQAGNSLDADRFFAFILDSDKGPIIQDGQLFKTRAQALESVQVGFQQVAKIERTYDQIYVTVLSQDVALLSATGSYTATLSDGQTQMKGPFAVSLVWVLRDGQWKVLHGHYSTPNQ
jgi:uncharacterized protein (TIGR02246 family)